MAVLLGIGLAAENMPQFSMCRLSSPEGSAQFWAALAMVRVRSGLENIVVTGLTRGRRLMSSPESLSDVRGTLSCPGLACLHGKVEAKG